MYKFKDIEALYIHIPFCNSICTYCDFYKMLAGNDKKKEYVDYLVKELVLKKDYLDHIKTIYIGGGTPTSLPLETLEYLLSVVETYVDMEKIVEYTIEANPIDLTSEVCKLLAKHHINRVSIGAQSFKQKKLDILGRKHTKKDIAKAVNNLHHAKIKNVNLDLIYATPKDSFYKFKKDLVSALKLKITHISTYALILEEHTVLYKKYLDGEFNELNGDKQAKIYYKTNKFLAANGFNHYEISNYAKPGFESKHNLTYWNNEKYVGIGASSSYYLDNTRYTNIHNLRRYYEGIDQGNLYYYDEEMLTPLDQIKEEIILGLRKVDGIDLVRFNFKFGKTIFDFFENEINDLISKKLLVLTSDQHLKIPENKLFVSNAIMEKFI